jgi:hypothetical protein
MKNEVKKKMHEDQRAMVYQSHRGLSVMKRILTSLDQF